jgi:hypothetical protein
MRLTLRATAGPVLAGSLLVAVLAGTVAAAGPTPLPAIPAADSARCARPAQGEGVDSVGNLRRYGDCEIDRRLALLERLADQVADASALTAAHRTALAGEIAATARRLEALRVTIDRETNVDALKAAIGRIATDHRVYVLVAPKTRLIILADRLAAGYSRFEAVQQRLADEIARAKAAGKDTAAAQAAYDAMTAKIEKAEGLLGPVAGSILPLTPTDWNAGTAKPALVAARSTLREVAGLFAGARADARTCAKALRVLR